MNVDYEKLANAIIDGVQEAKALAEDQLDAAPDDPETMAYAAGVTMVADTVLLVASDFGIKA